MKQAIFTLFTVVIYFLGSGSALKAQDSTKGKWVVSEYNERYQFGGPRFPIHMAHYKDESVIIAGLQTQTSPGAPSYVFINRTKDGGKTWHRIFEKENSEFLFYQVAHPSPRHIVALAEKFAKDSMGKDVKQLFLLTSSDTGATWVENNPFFPVFLPGEYPRSLHFKEQYGMLTITTATRNELWYTFDYGTRWQKMNLPNDLSHADGQVLGFDEFLIFSQVNKKGAYSDDLTTNGFLNYFTLPDYFSQMSLSVISKDTFWSAARKPSGVGNTSRNLIMNTPDGGESWNTALDVFEDAFIQRNGLNAIAFADKMHGAAVGSNVSYLTDNGGKTWYKRNLAESATGFNAATQSMAYYYNPVTRKSMLLTLLNLNYVLRYDFDAMTASITPAQNHTANISVYPNPVQDQLNVSINESVKTGATLVVYDNTGRKIISQTIAASSGPQNININTSQLPAGVYLMQLQLNNDLIRQFKFVK